ncbi:hypothetical protein ACEE32_11170, partial [Streptococcus thoraltensis]
IIGNPSLNHRYRKGFYSLFKTLQQNRLWSEASDNTKRKYRKLSKRIAKEDELTQHLKASFSENIDTLKRELETWLGAMKVNLES